MILLYLFAEFEQNMRYSATEKTKALNLYYWPRHLRFGDFLAYPDVQKQQEKLSLFDILSMRKKKKEKKEKKVQPRIFDEK